MIRGIDSREIREEIIFLTLLLVRSPSPNPNKTN